MSYEYLKFEEQDNIGILKICRPQALNSLNDNILTELEQFFAELRGVRCLVVTGEGKAFVAGADVKEFKDKEARQARQISERGQKLFTRIEETPFPVIAAINGFALGGGLELALACDFIIASEKAKMGLPEVGLGLIPGYGGTQRLARQIGEARAKAITLSGDVFPAAKMAAWGLVVEVVKEDDLLKEALKWATTISSKSPCAIEKVKKAIHHGLDQNLSAGLDMEAELFGECFKSNDQKEGVQAFLEKRTPKFTGN